MVVTGKSDPNEALEPENICDKCGSKLVFEDNEWVCPHCDGDIDFFGEDEDE